MCTSRYATAELHVWHQDAGAGVVILEREPKRFTVRLGHRILIVVLEIVDQRELALRHVGTGIDQPAGAAAARARAYTRAGARVGEHGLHDRWRAPAEETRRKRRLGNGGFRRAASGYHAHDE